MNLQRSLLYLIAFTFMAGPAVTAEAGIVSEEVVYYTDGKNVKGYFARPDDTQKHPGIILIHEWWGLNDNIRDNAKKFAALGYVALAVDLYDGHAATTPDEARKLATAVRKNMPAMHSPMKAANVITKRPPISPGSEPLFSLTRIYNRSCAPG